MANQLRDGRLEATANRTLGRLKVLSNDLSSGIPLVARGSRIPPTLRSARYCMRLLLLDEPTTGLDPRGRIELWDAIRALVAQGTDVLLTTQHLDEADNLASHVVIVDHGRARARGHCHAHLRSDRGDRGRVRRRFPDPRLGRGRARRLGIVSGRCSRRLRVC